MRRGVGSVAGVQGAGGETQGAGGSGRISHKGQDSAFGTRPKLEFFHNRRGGILKIQEIRMTPTRDENLTDYSEDGVDLTLIRWMLSLTPEERLQFAQRFSNRALNIRELNAGK